MTLTYIMKNTILLLLITIGFSCAKVQAQVTPKDSSEEASVRSYYLIKKTDGNELFGYIMTDDGREILLMTKSLGKIYINKSEIKEMVAIENTDTNDDKANPELAYQDFRLTGAYTTRYFFTTNALPIKKGEDYAMINLFGPEVHFALTDNFSLGIMSTWIASPIALAAKYSFKSKSKTHFSLGSIIASSGYILQGQGFGGLHFATITQGDRKSNISFSAGYGHLNLGPNGGLENMQNFIDYEYKTGRDYASYGGGTFDSAINNEIINNGGDPYNQLYHAPARGAAVFSIAGIAPVGKKASFIFDSMVFLKSRKKQEVVYNDYDLTVTYDFYPEKTDPYDQTPVVPIATTETVTIQKGTLVESGGGENSTTIILMPAMRFSKSYNKAFQVSLAGVILISIKRSPHFLYPWYLG
jgi:hypothetical protein